MRSIFTIAFHTVADELHHKSFYVLTGVSILLVLLLRGCYKAELTFNGQQVQAAEIGWYASVVAFHVIGIAGLLIGVLLSMRILGRDKTEGVQSFVLSKPIPRWSYVAGKIAGVWFISFAFMFVLHLTGFGILLFNESGISPWYLGASVLCSLNLLSIITIVMLLSSFMADVLAAIVGLAIIAVSFISDAVFAFSQSGMFQSMSQQNLVMEAPAVWRIIWPKIGATQFYSISFLTKNEYYAMMSINPLINVAFFGIIASLLLVWRFSREEIK